MTKKSRKDRVGSGPAMHRLRPFQGVVPEEMLNNLTPPTLKREGFERIAKGYYRKDFSGVLRLTMRIGSDGEHFYSWSIDAQRLQDLIDELDAVKRRIDRETTRLSRRWARARASEASARGKPTKHSGDLGAVMQELKPAAESIQQQKTEFRERYQDFMDVFTYSGGEPKLCGCSCFPLETCLTTQDLKAYFDFARLYLEVYVGLEKSTTGRASSRENTESVIQAYYVVLYTVRKMRKRYEEIVDFKAVERECPKSLRPSLEMILYPGEESSKKWEHRASKIALDLASSLYGTTPRNLRDVLSKHRGYAAIAQDYVASLKEPEILVFGGVPPRDLLPGATVHYGRHALRKMIRSILVRR